MDVGGLRDAASGDDAAEDGGDQLPFLKEVPPQDDLLGVVHVVADSGGSRISRDIPSASGCGLVGRGRHGDSLCGNGGGFLRRRSSGGGGVDRWLRLASVPETAPSCLCASLIV